MRERSVRAPHNPRWILIALTLCLLIGFYHPCLGYTEKEARQLFETLDPDHTGRVTKTQFEMYKMNAFYFSQHPTSSGQMKPLTFEETRLSRVFFDKIDQNHKGYIDGLDIHDGIHFEDIDARGRGYFDFSDLLAFLEKIGR